MSWYPVEKLTAEHRKSLRAEAAHQRLVAAARCCRRRAVDRLRAALRTAQPRAALKSGTSCCATA